MSVPTRLAIRKVYNNIIKSANYKNFFFLILLCILASIFCALLLSFTNFPGGTRNQYERIDFTNLHNLPEVKLNTKSVTVKSANRDPKCTYWNCFNIYRCGRTGHDRISVYVYPLKKYIDENGVPATDHISKEYLTLLKTVIKSKYYTADPEEACIFIPSIDTLNQDRIRLNLTSKALNSLPFWNNGDNHLIFNMVSGRAPDFSTVLELNLGNALIAAAGLTTYTFRQRYDISLPVFSHIARFGEMTRIHNKRSILVTSSQLNIDPYYLDELQKFSYTHQGSILIVDACHNHNYTQRCDIMTGKQYNYPQMLQNSLFCLIFRGERTGQFVLLEAMAANCIPVVVIDAIVMPFHNVIDWKHAAIFIMESHLNTLMDVLNNVSTKRIRQLQSTIKFLYNSYFSTMEKIVLTTLDLLQDRVYPHWSRSYDLFNLKPQERNTNPLFLPLTAPKEHGFTAVILTYDRVESLFTLIDRLSRVPSLMKVLVVWNNQKKQPPPVSEFPKIPKPFNIIRTKANRLSNRFYPYREIETEAILHIDDDIVMLTSDEIEFAYEVWREFPDRIVGFPSRTHIWNNVTNSWKYESEWTNEISMVLTGAAFLHKYWSYSYTNEMPANVRNWVDEQMNCEDIAMNFLVANVTNKPPIKVTPRKKFKCPECINNEMLSADIGHMIERSQCVDRFAQAFGRMPLKSVEFRADPVLFKDPFPEKLKRFNDIGSL